MIDDQQHLRQYLAGSQDAFAELVRKYIHLVFSAAQRQVRDRHLAEDVTQAVFLVLARKAPTLVGERALSGWLLRTTHLAAMDARRTEARRKQRETKAAQMTSPESSPEPMSWSETAPLLDEALANLSAADRRIIALRYFDGLPVKQAGELLGLTENAAKQRLSRAVRRLRDWLARKGIVAHEAALAAAILDNAVQPAPAALAETVSAAVAGGGVALAGSAAATIAKGAITIMAWTKLQTALVAFVVFLLLAGAAWTILHQQDPALDNQISAGIVGAADDAVPAPAGEARPADQSWKHAFDRVYRLEEGQVLKRVAPPFIPERRQFLAQLGAMPALESVTAGSGFSFTWDGGIQSIAGPMNSPPLEVVFSYCLGIPKYHFELPETVRGFRVSGDWVVRRDATDSQKLSALTAIVKQDWGRTIQFEQRTVKRSVIVAQGSFVPPSDPQEKIHLYIRQRRDTKDFVEGSVSDMLKAVGELAGHPVIDETDSGGVAALWVPPEARSLASTDIASLLANVSDQTGLKLTIELRDVKLWFAAED